MKKLLFLFLFIASFVVAQAQDAYVVQQVKGLVKAANKPVKPGDKLISSTSLQFSQGSMLLVSSQKHGATVLKPTASQGQSEASFLLNELLPQQMRASTKGGLVLCNPADFTDYFGSNTTFRVYGRTTEVSVCELAYQLSDSRFFYLTYNDPNTEEPLNVALPSNNKQFVLPVDSLSGFGTGRAPYRVNLAYYNMNTEESIALTSFKLAFVGEDAAGLSDAGQMFEAFKTEAAEMVAWLKQSGADKKTIVRNLANLGNQHFGPCEKDNMEAWLEDNFGIE